METQKAQDIENDELIRRAVDGDRGAFAVLIEQHYDKIYGIAWKFSGNKEDAEDITQDVVIKLARVLKGYRFDAAFTTWLYRVAVNASKDFLRSRNRKTDREMPIKEEILPVNEERQDTKLEVKEILGAVDKLPEGQKEVIMLVCWEGLSHKEAADILGCAETTVSWRLYEARKRLTQIVGGGAND